MQRIKRQMVKDQTMKSTISYLPRGGLKCPFCRKVILKTKKEFFQGDVIYLRNLNFMGHGYPKTLKKIPCPHCTSESSLEFLLATNSKVVKNMTLDFIIFAIVVGFVAVLYLNR